MPIGSSASRSSGSPVKTRSSERTSSFLSTNHHISAAVKKTRSRFRVPTQFLFTTRSYQSNGICETGANHRYAGADHRDIFTVSSRILSLSFIYEIFLLFLHLGASPYGYELIFYFSDVKDEERESKNYRQILSDVTEKPRARLFDDEEEEDEDDKNAIFFF